MILYTPSSDKFVHNTTVDFKRRIVNEQIHIVQYDNSLPIIAVSLYSDYIPYHIPTNAEGNIRVKKPDGTYVYNPALGCNSDRTVLYFEVTNQMTMLHGELNPIIEIRIGASVGASSTIKVIVDKNPISEGDVESTNEYKVIEDYVDIVKSSASVAKQEADRAAEEADRATGVGEEAKRIAESASQDAQSAVDNSNVALQSADEALQVSREIEKNYLKQIKDEADPFSSRVYYDDSGNIIIETRVDDGVWNKITISNDNRGIHISSRDTQEDGEETNFIISHNMVTCDKPIVVPEIRGDKLKLTGVEALNVSSLNGVGGIVDAQNQSVFWSNFRAYIYRFGNFNYDLQLCGRDVRPVYMQSDDTEPQEVAFLSDIPDISNVPEITLNGALNNAPAFYAPVSGGTKGQILRSNGANAAPSWGMIQPQIIPITGIAMIPSGEIALLAVGGGQYKLPSLRSLMDFVQINDIPSTPSVYIHSIRMINPVHSTESKATIYNVAFTIITSDADAYTAADMLNVLYKAGYIATDLHFLQATGAIMPDEV